MSTEQSLDPHLIEQTKQQIRGLVNEIAQLTKSGVSPEEFHGQYLPKVVQALAAVAGAMWTMEEGRLGLAHQVNIQETRLPDMPDDQVRHGRLLQKVLTSGEPMLIPPHSGAGDDTEAANPTDFLLVLGPVKTDLEVVGVLEIFQRSDAGPATQRGYMRFVTQMCDLAGDFFKTRKLKHFSDRQAMWTQLEEFTRSVHASLDPREAAYTIANEGRRLIECDRVSVGIQRANKCRIEAVSGQDLFDKRSNTVRLLANLATAVVAGGEPVWYTGDTSDMAPQIEDAVQEYVDDSHSKTVAVLPLIRPRPEPTDDKEELALREEPEVAIGALIVEQIEDSRVPDKMLQRVDVVAQHSAMALCNATDYNSLFLMPVWRTLGKARWLVKARTLPKTSLVAGTIVAILLFLVLWPGNFELEGKGTLEPVDRRDVFAGIDGVVKEVFVEHADSVHHHALVSAGVSNNGRDVMAEFRDDPNEAGTQYRMLTVVDGNARFQTAGVRPGDTVHLFVSLSGGKSPLSKAEFGTPDESESDEMKDVRVLIDEVVDENTIRIRGRAGRALTLSAHKIEVWRTSPLVRLDNVDLDVAIEGVVGDIAITQEQISLIARSLSVRGLPENEREQLQSRDLEQKQKLESLQLQLALYRLKQQELLVTSPMEGQVITWDVNERLIGRPVQRGQALMRVADPAGPWHLEVEMPEKYIGHIAKAQNRLKPGLDVEYILATDPGTKRLGTIKEVAESAEVIGEEGNTVLIKIEIDTEALKAEIPQLRPGATVRARVRCGKRSIGYVWVHEAIAYVQSRILFRLF